MKIFLIGFMGSGKTHWGEQISRKVGMPFFDLDTQVVNTEEKSVNDIFRDEGEEYFRKLEKETLHLITESHHSFVMATGGGAPCYFNNIEYMNLNGTTVWLNTPQDKLFSRLVKEKDHRPLLRDLTDDQLRNFISRKFADRTIYYEQAKITVDESNECLEDFVSKIFHA